MRAPTPGRRLPGAGLLLLLLRIRARAGPGDVDLEEVADVLVLDHGLGLVEVLRLALRGEGELKG